MIDVLMGQPSYEAHVRPVLDALGDDAGTVHRSWRSMAAQGGPVLVASGADARQVPRARPVALMQHGIGQSYNGAGESNLSWGYAGGAEMGRVGLFLCVNEAEAQQWRARYPDAEIAVVGAPNMDEWYGVEFQSPRHTLLNRVPTVAVSFHWKCTAQIESGTAWPEWRLALLELAMHAEERGYRLLGHEHPRWHGRLLEWWRRIGVEGTDDWGEVMQRASVYCCDNSSTMYEFMATRRPVIGLRSAHWRIDVEHGLRFWEYAPPVDLHPNVGAAGLHAAIRAALDQGDPFGLERDVVRRVYDGLLDGRSATRAADALRSWAARSRVRARREEIA